MTALVAWIVVTLLTGAVVARFTGWNRPPVPLRASTDLADHARKFQAVLSSLAGFAVTSIVLLITFSGNRLDVQSESSVDLIALLVVAYLGFVVGGIMYASIEPVRTRTGVDLLPAQHAVASTQFYRSILSGWLALGPLIAIVGVERLTRFVLALLLIAILGGWIFHGANLTTLGYGERRFVTFAPLVGLAGAFVFAAVVHFVPQLRSTDVVLFLTGAGAVLGATAHFVFHSLRTVAEDLPGYVTRRLHVLVAVDSYASQVLMAFLWLGIAGLL
jgi:hypothetical protein